MTVRSTTTLIIGALALSLAATGTSFAQQAPKRHPMMHKAGNQDISAQDAGTAKLNEQSLQAAQGNMDFHPSMVSTPIPGAGTPTNTPAAPAK